MDELADQLTGVLHEIASADSGTPHPRLSTHFSPQRAIYGAGWDVPLTVASVIAALGVPRVDASDPGAALLATTSGTPPAQLEQTLQHAVGESNRPQQLASRCRCDWSVHRWSSASPRTRASGSPNSNPCSPATGG